MTVTQSSRRDMLPLDEVWLRIKHAFPFEMWERCAPLILQIRELKARTNTIILAHNYQPLPIVWGVADFVGDSLELARLAQQERAERVLMCGVHFMAESVKLLNPDATVLIPSLEAGCSLAASISAEQVRQLRSCWPKASFVAYVNTSAEVKALVDVCCTSANALQIVERCPSDVVVFLPDEHLADYVRKQTSKKIISWAGACEVHETFDVPSLTKLKQVFPQIEILAHPECLIDVQEAADFVGSTSAMIHYVRDRRPAHVAMITECTMSDNVAAHFPDVRFTQPCTLCPHMRRITLENIKHALENAEHEISIPAATAAAARASLEAMLSQKIPSWRELHDV